MYFPLYAHEPISILHFRTSNGNFSRPSNLQMGFRWPGRDQKTEPSGDTDACVLMNEDCRGSARFQSSRSGVQISEASVRPAPSPTQ